MKSNELEKKEKHDPDSHACCNLRLEKEGGKAHCCSCVPHENCEMIKPKQNDFIEKKLEEFDEKFSDLHSDSGLGGDECFPSDERDSVKSFLRTALEESYSAGKEEERKRVLGVVKKSKYEGDSGYCGRCYFLEKELRI